MSSGGLYRIDHLFEICRHHQSGHDCIRQFSPAWRASRNARKAPWQGFPWSRSTRSQIGIGVGLAAVPSHTTVRTGPYTAVRRIKVPDEPRRKLEQWRARGCC
jgi:hypothetical protein